MYNPFATFFAIFAGAIVFFTIVGIILYVLMALGLYKLAQNRGIENEWLAWIPVANLYILGQLVGPFKLGSWDIKDTGLYLLVGTVGAAVLSWIPVIGVLLDLAAAVFYFIVLYNLFKIYRPESATLYLVLSIVFVFMGPIFIFVIRNDAPRMNNMQQPPVM